MPAAEEPDPERVEDLEPGDFATRRSREEAQSRDLLRRAAAQSREAGERAEVSEESVSVRAAHVPTTPPTAVVD